MIADLQQQIGIDSSFYPQIIIFIFVFLWLRFFFFAPFLRLINKREGQSEGLSEDAQKLEEESALLEAQYQEVLSGARKRAYAEREVLLVAARKEGTEQVAASREKAKIKLEQARASAVKSSEVELAGLESQVAPISAMLVDKLMNTKVGL